MKTKQSMSSKNPQVDHNAILISMFDAREQASPISEGVAEI
jgi:hypothetical protein